MSLRGVSAELLNSGKPTIRLFKMGRNGSETLASLPIIKADQRHRNFILSTWMKSYADQAKAQGIHKWFVEHEPAISESRWMDCVVVTDDTGFTVHAWVCGAEGKLWHVYVVPELRKLRIATRLIEYACGPEGLKEYARPWPYAAHARINPYLLRTKDDV